MELCKKYSLNTQEDREKKGKVTKEQIEGIKNKHQEDGLKSNHKGNHTKHKWSKHPIKRQRNWIGNSDIRQSRFRSKEYSQ